MARRWRRPPLLHVLATAIATVALLPVAVTLVQASQAGWADARDTLLRPLVGELLVNTLGMAAATTVVCAVAGTGTAWLVERTTLPGRRVWRVLAVVPLAIPPFISSFGWLSLSARLQGAAGALLVVSSAYMPLVFLPVAAALRGLDPALEEAARTLGRGPWSTFFRVVLPQLRPALLGGMLLVALNLLGEFGAFTLLRFRTFTTELYAEYRTGFDGPGASLLAVVLLVLCLLCLTLEFRVRAPGRHAQGRYARVSRGAARPAAPHALGWLAIPALAWVTTLAIATLGVPLGMIAYWLTRHGAAAITPSAVSAARLLAATSSSLSLAAMGAIVTVALSLPLAFLAARDGGRLVSLLERACFMTQGIPAIVVALALITLTLGAAAPLYQSTAALIAAYAILFLPLALVCARTALVQVPRRLDEVARSLGAGPAAVAWRVLLPLAGAGLGAGLALVFVSVVTELTATLLLAPVGTRTLATEVWANTSALAFAAAAPYAALMAAISLVSTALLGRGLGGGGHTLAAAR